MASVAIAAAVPSAQVQIAGAVLAAPMELREGAAVLGFDAQGGRVQIREGKNHVRRAIFGPPGPVKQRVSQTGRTETPASNWQERSETGRVSRYGELLTSRERPKLGLRACFL